MIQMIKTDSSAVIWLYQKGIYHHLQDQLWLQKIQGTCGADLVNYFIIAVP